MSKKNYVRKPTKWILDSDFDLGLSNKEQYGNFASEVDR